MKYFILLMISFYTVSLFGFDDSNSNSNFTETNILEIDSTTFMETGYEVIKTITKLPNGFRGTVGLGEQQENKLYIAVLLRNTQLEREKIKLIIKNLDNSNTDVEIKDIYTLDYSANYNQNIAQESNIDFVVDKANEVMFLYSYLKSASFQKTLYLHYSQVSSNICNNNFPLNDTTINECKIELLYNYSPVSIILTKENDNPYISLMDSNNTVRVLKLPKAWSSTAWTVALTDSQASCPNYQDADRSEDSNTDNRNFACMYFVKSLTNIQTDADVTAFPYRLEILEGEQFSLKLVISLIDTSLISVPAYSLDIDGTYLYSGIAPNIGFQSTTFTDINSLIDNNNIIKTYFLRKTTNTGLVSLYNGSGSGNEFLSFPTNNIEMKLIKFTQELHPIILDNTLKTISIYNQLNDTLNPINIPIYNNLDLKFLSADSIDNEIYITFYMNSDTFNGIKTTKIEPNKNPDYKIANTPADCDNDTGYNPLSMDNNNPMIINMDNSNKIKYLCLKGIEDGSMINYRLNGGGLSKEEMPFIVPTEDINCDSSTYCYKKITVKDGLSNKAFAILNIYDPMDTTGENSADFYLSYAPTGINDLIIWPNKPVFASNTYDTHSVLQIIPNLNGDSFVSITGAISLPNDNMEIGDIGIGDSCPMSGSTLSFPCSVYIKFKNDVIQDGRYPGILNLYNGLSTEITGIFSTLGIIVINNQISPLEGGMEINISNGNNKIEFKNITQENKDFSVTLRGVNATNYCVSNILTFERGCTIENITLDNGEGYIDVCLNLSGCDNGDSDPENDSYTIFLTEGNTNLCGGETCKEWEECDTSLNQCAIKPDRCENNSDCGDTECSLTTHRCVDKTQENIMDFGISIVGDDYPIGSYKIINEDSVEKTYIFTLDDKFETFDESTGEEMNCYPYLDTMTGKYQFIIPANSECTLMLKLKTENPIDLMETLILLGDPAIEIPLKGRVIKDALLFWSQEGFKTCDTQENGKFCINDVNLVVNNEYTTLISIAKEPLLENREYLMNAITKTDGIKFIDWGAEDCRNIGKLSVPGDICYLKMKFTPTEIKTMTEMVTVPNIANFIFTLNITELEEDISVSIPAQDIDNIEVENNTNVNFGKIVKYAISNPFVVEIKHLSNKTGNLKVELTNKDNFFVSSNCSYDYESQVLTNNLDKKCNLLIKFIPSDIKTYNGVVTLKNRDRTIKTINLTGVGIEDNWKDEGGWCNYGSNHNENSLVFILFLFSIIIIRRKKI